MFHLDLLGPFSASIDGTPYGQFGTNRGQALLAYLALENERAHQREALMHLLWPDMPLKSTQGNLRQTIYLLRKALENAGVTEPPFLTARQTVQINPDFLLTVDASRFEAAVAAGSPQSRQEAAELYRGPFLEDFYLPDSEPFEEWAAARRAAYGRLALDNLDQLAALSLAGADYAGAEAAARRAMALDDLHEPAHRQLIEALAAGGNQQAAIAHYESFRGRLLEELDVEPAEATQTLAAAIRGGEYSAAQIEEAAVEAAVPEPVRLLRQNLPAQTKPFIGREADLQRLDDFFTENGTRLVTILGPGGMGKTQLAIEWARAQVDGIGRYRDGTYFVDLTPLESADQVAPAMAEIFAFPLQGERRSPEQQMLDYLREKKLLLVLDNFEQIIGASPFVNDILLAAPGVDIVTTSRERLHLSPEQIFAIDGLAYPPATQPGQDVVTGDLESYPAMELLLRSVRRIQPDYVLKPEDHEPAARICRHTAGMPLAIELAASCIDLMPLEEIADEIEKCLTILETDLRDLPERHRSIRAAINATWNNLEPADQRLFTLLSIFRGGFTWEAATAILEFESGEPGLRRALSRLRDRSLISYDARYECFTIHDLLRQYGAEKLGAEDEQDASETKDRHTFYYSQLLQDCEADLKGSTYDTILHLIDGDIENMLAAWDGLVEEECQAELAAVMNSLGLFLEIRGYYATGQRIFSSLTARQRKRLAESKDDASETASDLRFLAKALAWQSAFELDQLDRETLLQESLALLDDPRIDAGTEKAERAFTYYRLGQVVYNSQMARAIELLNLGLTLYQELGDSWGIGHCLLLLGYTNLFVDLVTSRHYLLQAGEVFEQNGDIRGLGLSLNWLIGVAVLQGDDETVEKAVEQYQALVIGIEQPAFVEETIIINILVSEHKGRYGEAIAYRENWDKYKEELGRDTHGDLIFKAVIYLHNGRFDDGRALLQETQDALRETDVEDDHRLAFCEHILAMLDLAEGEFAQAQRHLQEAMPAFEKNNNLPDLAGAYSLTGMALVGQGDLDAARQQIIAGLELALDHRGFIPLGESLLGAALLLAHQGQLVRAREIYELVWRQPRFRGSVLYDLIAAEEIRAVTGSLSPDELAAITRRTAELDIWQEGAALRDTIQ